MLKLSTDKDSTLGNYREMCVLSFGKDSHATKFLDQKIAEQGAEAEVIAEECMMVRLLADIHQRGENPPEATIHVPAD